MDDLISRKAILKHIEKIQQSVQMMDDIRRASIIMNGMYLCEKAVRNQPSAEKHEISNCPNCGAPIDPCLDRCPYCLTPYAAAAASRRVQTKRTCDTCKHYHWYYDRCDLYECETDPRSVCATWEGIECV